MNKAYPGLGSALGILALALGAQAGVAFVLTLAWPGFRDDLTLLAGTANLVALVSVGCFGFWRSGKAPVLSPVPGVGVRMWGAMALTVLGGSIVLGEVANITAWAVPLPPELAKLFNQLSDGPVMTALFTLAVVAPLTEEALFRGLLLRGFAQRYGVTPGLLMSSSLFALFHLNVWQALPAFLAGLYLGWIYLFTGSLLYPMVVHGLFNGLPVGLAALGLKVQGYNTQATPGAPDFQPWPWVAVGLILLGLGLAMTKKWAPLSPATVSDRVGTP